MTTETPITLITGRGSWEWCRQAQLNRVRHLTTRATAAEPTPPDDLLCDLAQAKGDARAFGWTNAEILAAVGAGVSDYLREALS